MPYYLLQIPGGNLGQILASTPLEARQIAANHLGMSIGQIVVRDTMDTPFTNTFITGGLQDEVPTGGDGVTGGLENVFPQAAYERGLQRQGQNPEGFLSNYLESLYRPAAATFGIKSALGAAPAGDLENAFQSYVSNTPVSNIRGEATNAFRSLGAPTAAMTADQQATLAGYANPYGAGPKGGADEDKIQNLIALAGQAASTRYSPFAAQQLLPGGATVRRRYERGGLQGSLYDFLKRQYGLTGGF